MTLCALLCCAVTCCDVAPCIVAAQAGMLVALYFVVAFGSSLDVAAIQADMPRELDYDRELVTVGEAPAPAPARHCACVCTPHHTTAHPSPPLPTPSHRTALHCTAPHRNTPHHTTPHHPPTHPNERLKGNTACCNVRYRELYFCWLVRGVQACSQSSSRLVR
jgi:hypothetical protein